LENCLEKKKKKEKKRERKKAVNCIYKYMLLTLSIYQDSLVEAAKEEANSISNIIAQAAK
jgi:hypothetical protein